MYEEAQAVRETEVVNANLAAALEEQALRTFARSKMRSLSSRPNIGGSAARSTCPGF
jgi:hypothetical protein